MKLNTEKMPKAVKDLIGTAQKNLTQLEGKAREKLQGTYQKVTSSEVFKNVEQKVSEIKKAAADVEKKVTPIRRKVEQFSSDMARKAFDTIGVATKADLKTISAKVDTLKKEIRRFLPQKKSVENRTNAN